VFLTLVTVLVFFMFCRTCDPSVSEAGKMEMVEVLGPGCNDSSEKLRGLPLSNKLLIPEESDSSSPEIARVLS
jgi:hypothetical protein